MPSFFRKRPEQQQTNDIYVGPPRILGEIPLTDLHTVLVRSGASTAAIQFRNGFASEIDPVLDSKAILPTQAIAAALTKLPQYRSAKLLFRSAWTTAEAVEAPHVDRGPFATVAYPDSTTVFQRADRPYIVPVPPQVYAALEENGDKFGFTDHDLPALVDPMLSETTPPPNSIIELTDQIHRLKRPKGLDGTPRTLLNIEFHPIDDAPRELR